MEELRLIGDNQLICPLCNRPLDECGHDIQFVSPQSPFPLSEAESRALGLDEVELRIPEGVEENDE